MEAKHEEALRAKICFGNVIARGKSFTTYCNGSRHVTTWRKWPGNWRQDGEQTIETCNCAEREATRREIENDWLIRRGFGYVVSKR